MRFFYAPRNFIDTQSNIHLNVTLSLFYCDLNRLNAYLVEDLAIII